MGAKTKPRALHVDIYIKGRLPDKLIEDFFLDIRLITGQIIRNQQPFSLEMSETVQICK
jgi:hypothetical protein